MKQNYLLDLTEESSSIIHTPSLSSQMLPFFIHNCGHFYAGSGYFTEREGLNNYLLIYTAGGAGYITYKGNQYTLAAGQAFIVDCNEPHCYKTGDTGSWEIKWVHFNGTACKYYYNLINEDSLNIIKLNDFSELERYLDEIPLVIVKNDLHTDIKLSMLMTNILTELVVNRLNPSSKRSYVQQRCLIDKAIDYIHVNYQKAVQIKDIVKQLHASEYHFMRLFKKHVGISAYEYLTNYRINKSKAILKSTDIPVGEIAISVGFNNVNNYIRDFKKLVGTTPLKYRNYWMS